jgi:hypothetical protein
MQITGAWGRSSCTSSTPLLNCWRSGSGKGEAAGEGEWGKAVTGCVVICILLAGSPGWWQGDCR